MAICTRFGSEVEIVGPIDNEGWVAIRYAGDHRKAGLRQIHLSDLKADGGVEEIMRASEKCKTETAR